MTFMNASEHDQLILAFRQGKISAFPVSTLSPSAQEYAQLLKSVSSRDWASVHRQIVELSSSPAFSLYRGELKFLEAQAFFSEANYAAAAEAYAQAGEFHTPECTLFRRGYIDYNIYVAKTFAPDFSFGKELPLLRKTSQSARDGQDALLLGQVFNSYGNHALLSGRFKRAFEQFRAAAAQLEKTDRPINYLDSLANSVLAGLQIGAFNEATRSVQILNTRMLEMKDAYLRERMDRVYAEYLVAQERFDEAITHLDFTMSDKAPFESARMALLKAGVLLELGRPGAGPLLEEISRFISDHRLSQDVFVDFHVTEAAHQMSRGNLDGAYQEILRAEVLAESHHNAHLRAVTMLQKARLNFLRGKAVQAAQIAMEVIRVAGAQGFALLLMRAISSLAEPDLIAALEADDRRLLTKWLESGLPVQGLSRTERAFVRIKKLLGEAQSETASIEKMSRVLQGQSLAPARQIFEIRYEDPDSGIYYLDAKGDPLLFAKLYRLSGKLLTEFLKSPNRDLSCDHLHTQIWGGPIRNESHIQKLKTLASRLRAELREQKIPAEIESREYSTYRLVTDLRVQHQGASR